MYYCGRLSYVFTYDVADKELDCLTFNSGLISHFENEFCRILVYSVMNDNPFGLKVTGDNDIGLYIEYGKDFYKKHKFLVLWKINLRV